MTPSTCYRHPDRTAGVRCQRCDRLICPACMKQASVGFHCPECVAGNKQKVYTSATLWSGRPLATQILIGINVALFVVGIALGDTLFSRRATGGLFDDLALFAPFVDRLGEWWRIFTSGFMHLGALHLAMNMYALWILGADAERRLGAVRYSLVYLSALVAGSFGALLVSPLSPTVGASGAIYGLLGLAIAAHRARGLSIWSSGLGTILLINFAVTIGLPGISIGGHVGGLVGGYLAGVVVEELPHRMHNLPRWIPELALVGLSALWFVGALWAATTWTNPIF